MNKMTKKPTINGFAPYHYKTKKRIKIKIYTEDYQKCNYQNRFKWTKIKDLTNKRYILVRAASYGLDCFCDAKYKEI